MYYVSSREAKTDERLRKSGNLIAYSFLEQEFPAQPTTAFYDWLYITALWQNRGVAEKLLEFKGFSDIAFNPKRSINCQAHAAALFVALYQRGDIEKVMKNKDYYIQLVNHKKSQKYFNPQKGKQLNLFTE